MSVPTLQPILHLKVNAVYVYWFGSSQESHKATYSKGQSGNRPTWAIHTRKQVKWATQESQQCGISRIWHTEEVAATVKTSPFGQKGFSQKWQKPKKNRSKSSDGDWSGRDKYEWNRRNTEAYMYRLEVEGRERERESTQSGSFADICHGPAVADLKKKSWTINLKTYQQIRNSGAVALDSLLYLKKNNVFPQSKGLNRQLQNPNTINTVVLSK